MSEWQQARLGDICTKITDGTHHSPPNHPMGAYKYVTAKNIKPWGLDLTDITYVDETTHREIYARCDVKKNDILYIKDGATTGRAALNTLNEEFSLLSSVGVLRPGPKIKSKYLLYALQEPQVLKSMLADVAGVAITRLTLKKLKDAIVPLAPIEQQDDIVAEIEKQFSRLDEAVAGLLRVKANLKRYKAAVLKAAVEGRLVPTEATLARQQNRPYETGEQLLHRILETRRSQWQGKGKYKEPIAPEIPDAQELPVGWASASPEQLSAGEPHSLAIGPFGSSLKVSDYRDNGVPLVFVRNIRSASFGDSSTVFVSDEKATELKAHWVAAGDLLITKMGDPPGDVCVYPRDRPIAVITADCIKLRAAPLVHPMFLAYAIESMPVHRQILGITKGVAQLKVSLGRFSSIAIPLPPLAEQHRIVAEVDRRLSLVRGVEAEVEANLKRAQSLRQSILSKAFAQ